jgi:L-ascorbate metabolism protein UlaG (beta-lactamase superfamily)
LVGSALTVFGCAGHEERPPLTVTYVANAGFMVECGDEKILIDALFGGWESPWYFSPPDSIVQLMSAAQAPFDEVDLIAVTHAHRDHFSAEIVMSYLQHNRQAELVCPPQVVQQLQADRQYAELEKRILVIAAPPDTAVATTVGGIQLRILPGRHSPYYEEDEATGETVDRHRDVQHLEYLFTINGRPLFHCGDAELNDFERYRKFGLGNEPIDLAFVPWWDASDQLSFHQRLVRDVFRPDRIILMHLMPDREPTGHPEQQEGVARQVVLPTHTMQTWTFE